MIKKLWLKLVLLYTGITGLILALCLGITFFFSCNRYEASLDAQICDQIESYQIKLLSSRQVDQSTLQELEEKARAMGANAVIGIDLDYETVGERGSMLMVTASGTAVRVEG